MFRRLKMRVTYIHHSSFLVETKEDYFLFDYFEGEIPELKEDQPLLVFASHRHGDHFSPVIFELVKKHEKTSFVLSDDIWRRRVPEELLGRTYFIGPEETLQLTAPLTGESGVKIRAFRSTDEGVAFLLETEGKGIYHAGDLNNWVWDGEPEADTKRMSEKFHKELEKMKGIHIDVAFMLLDPRQEKDFYLGMDDFMKMVGADVVFPMHFWGDFQVTDRLKELDCAKDYKDRIVKIHEKGECFVV